MMMMINDDKLWSMEDFYNTERESLLIKMILHEGFLRDFPHLLSWQPRCTEVGLEGPQIYVPIVTYLKFKMAKVYPPVIKGAQLYIYTQRVRDCKNNKNNNNDNNNSNNNNNYYYYNYNYNYNNYNYNYNYN